MRKHFLFLVTAAFLAIPFSCTQPAPVDSPEETGKTEDPGKPETPETPVINPEDLQPITFEALLTDDRIWESKPNILIRVTNPNPVAVPAEFLTRISTDKKKQVATIEFSKEIPAESTEDVLVTTQEALEPGFYRATNFVNEQQAGIFNFGISPFQIVSAPDYQPDFEAFWAAAKAQLPPINEQTVNMIEMTGKSTQYRKVYLVELKSVPDGPDGEPVTVRGYYCEPQDGRKHPVLMHFYGYDTQGSTSKPDCPGGGSSSEAYAEFYLSHRGQYINNRPASSREPDGLGDLVNIYGDWFAYNFGDKDAYYYRGAFMDCVQAVNFLASRETSDMDKLFGWGSSQGGALSYAAAALSDYPFRAIAPCVAFLGDFPDYFIITGWPASTAQEQQKAKGLSDAQMYTFLSYFDTKNLATLIPASTAVMACSGLMDTTCPPHTNIAPFNNLKTLDKEYYFYPKMTHDIPKDWGSKYTAFFKARIQ